MKATPSAAFEMPEPNLLLEFLIVALDTPAQLGHVHQRAESNVLRKRREPVFGRRVLALWPLHQQPFFRPAVGEIVIAMRSANPHTRKARGQPLGRPLAPLDRAPSALWQAESQLLDRDRSMLVISADELRWTPLARPFFRWQRPRAGCPHRGVWQDAGHIAQSERADAGAQVRVAAITRVHQYHAARKAGLAGRLDLLQRDL